MGQTWKPRRRNPHRLVLAGNNCGKAIPMGTPRGGTQAKKSPECLKTGERVIYCGREWNVENDADGYTLVCGDDGRAIDMPTATARTMLYRGHMQKV